MGSSLRVGIVGVSGYTGRELFALLLKHPGVQLCYVAALNTQGPMSLVYPEFLNRSTQVCQMFNLQDARERCDLVFLALPHTESMKVVPQLLNAGLKVIDLSADYRVNNEKMYEARYGHTHTDSENLSKAIYGLPELFRESIKGALLLANPGCYATAAILGLAPLIFARKDILSIVIDAKSGVSGAGRKAIQSLLYSEINENFRAYNVLNHPHTLEIESVLAQFSSGETGIHFVAHLLPMTRGILNTMYVHLNETITVNTLQTMYRHFYRTESFVRLLPVGDQPETKRVAHTNFCDIGLAISHHQNMVVITSAIDNLMKGAAGQAVQNMNILCGMNEGEGLL